MANNIQLKHRTEKYITEFLKCKRSFNYVWENYVLVELPGGDIKLKPYEAQKKLVKALNDEHFVLVLKSRQIGISTITQAYATWLCVFHDNAVIGIISKDGPEATSFARGIAGMIDKLPAWMKPPGGQSGAGFAKRSEQSFILTNGSKCYAATVNPKAPAKTLRGKSITFLIIDEAAFIEHLDEAWTSMIPALSTSQKHAKQFNVPYGIMVLSTPNKTVGVGAWFYKKYKDAVAKDSILKNFVIHWKDIPELANDPDWYKTQCQLFDNDPKKISQELELKFVATSGTFFPEKTCEILQERTQEDVKINKIHIPGSGEIWQFAPPIKGRFYIIGVDTATEYGDDNSAITVWDYETLDQVWEYGGKCEVTEFIKVVRLACATYPGLVVIERNSYGEQVVKAVKDSEFAQYVYHEKTGVDNSILKPGLATTSKSRPLILDALYDYISKYPESVKSHRLALELIGLIEKPNGRVEADKGSKDDLALSAALAFYVRKFDPPLLLNRPEEFSDEFNSIMTLNDELVPSLNGMNSPEDLSSKIIKEIKGENLGTDGQNYIDVLDLLYNKK